MILRKYATNITYVMKGFTLALNNGVCIVQDCDTVPVQDCDTVPVQDCDTVPVQDCDTVPAREHRVTEYVLYRTVILYLHGNSNNRAGPHRVELYHLLR